MPRPVLYLYAILSVFVCSMVIGCGVVTDPVIVCGQNKTYDHVLNVFNSDLNGTTREIYIEGPIEPKDICSREGHVTPTYFALAQDPVAGIPADIQLFGVARIPGYTQRSVALVNDGTGKFKGDVEIGLKQAYGEGAGYIIMQVLAKFPSRGDSKVDSAYLVSHVKEFHATLNYKEYLEVTE